MQLYDALTLLSNKQALTVSAASTDHFNGLKDRNIGIGEPMALVIRVDVALAGTTPTFQAKVQTDDNSSFSSATDIVTGLQYSSLAAGDVVVIPLPPDIKGEQYFRAYYTLGGTSPTITVTTGLMPLSSVPADAKYPAGWTV